MATILISHCERNLGRVEKHVGRGGELGEWGVSPSEPLNSLKMADISLWSFPGFIFFYTACRLLSARVRKAKLLIRCGYI